MLIPFDFLFQKYQIKSKGVLHIGASTGQEAAAYASQDIRRVIWVEALPWGFTRLQRNVNNKWQNMEHICLNACVSDKDGETVTFREASNGGQSSSLLEFGTHAKCHPEVKMVAKHTMTTTRMDTLLNANGLQQWLPEGSFLNIDLQGAELMALKGLGTYLDRFDWAYIEVNRDHLYVGCPLVADIDAFLYERGFVGLEAKMTDWGWGDKLYHRHSIP